ncbi:MAG: DUF5330 domain-containing protein [Bauldia sp.]
MFFLRAAFWIAVVVMFIPNDPENGDAPRVTLIQAMAATRAAVQDIGQFCDRNPEVCSTSHAAIEVMADKARYGFKMLVQHFTHSGEEPRGTLTEADAAEPWRAPRNAGPI